MSLVHPSIVGILQRRFVSTFYNAFPGPGQDKGAKAFAAKVMKKAGVISLQYGAVVHPDGTLVNMFGFDMQEVACSFAEALDENPRLAWMTKEEERVLRRADLEPQNAAARVAAAKLWSELLQFDRARALLAPSQIAEVSQDDKIQLSYERAHLAVLDVWGNRQEAETELRAIENPPSKLAGDIALDLIALQIEKNPAGAFFTGSQMRAGSDATAAVEWLEGYLQDPTNTRVGEAMFFLGVAKLVLGNKEGANAVWERHYTDMPDDLLALSSRLHHSDYKFSPNNDNLRIEGGRIGDESVIEELKSAFESGKQLKIMGSNGREMTQEETEEFLRRMGIQVPKKKNKK